MPSNVKPLYKHTTHPHILWKGIWFRKDGAMRCLRCETSSRGMHHSLGWPHYRIDEDVLTKVYRWHEKCGALMYVEAEADWKSNGKGPPNGNV